MTGRLTRITRHPIKGHGREDLDAVDLAEDACLPWDRHWAVAHSAARVTDGWMHCSNFLRGAKTPELMAISATLDADEGEVTLRHPERGEIAFSPDDPADLPRFLDWVAPLVSPDRPPPAKIVAAGRGMTDSDFPSVSILSEASLAELSGHLGTPLAHERWRGNLWIEGAAPFAEFEWIGRDIRIGEARLHVRERITRCSATSVNPDTGKIDADTLGGLDAAYGHQDFGIYAVVVEGGTVRLGDAWSLA